MDRILDILFGCNHSNTSFPMTVRPKTFSGELELPSSASGTYIVCLECGKRFPYSWEEMKVVKSRERRPDKVVALHIEDSWASHHGLSSR
jgi:hypothetical protein